MAMKFDEVFEYFNSQDPHYDISRNSKDSELVTVNYSGFKTVCNQSDEVKSDWDVKMADFKRSIYSMLSGVCEIIGNDKLIIRLSKKENYFEVYDTMIRNLSPKEIKDILALCDVHQLGENGYTALIINFTMPVNEGQTVGDENTCMMFKWVPKEEDPNVFFGFII